LMSACSTHCAWSSRIVMFLRSMEMCIQYTQLSVVLQAPTEQGVVPLLAHPGSSNTLHTQGGPGTAFGTPRVIRDHWEIQKLTWVYPEMSTQIYYPHREVFSPIALWMLGLW
jgi:hypothetical protein